MVRRMTRRLSTRTWVVGRRVQQGAKKFTEIAPQLIAGEARRTPGRLAGRRQDSVDTL